MCLLCFIVVFLLGCSLYSLLGRTYTTLIAFGLYFKGPSLSLGLATPYSIWEQSEILPPTVVTPQLVADVLHVLRVEHPDYPGCEYLKTVSKDKMIFAFYKRPKNWGYCQFTLCKAFAKGPRFMNMVMTFVLHPLFHYNSITEPRARFLLALLEHFTIDFPSHFILSILDVYGDTATRDKLIFPSAIMQILCLFLVPFPSFDHFSVMCVIDYATIKCSEAQFRSWQSDSAASPSRLAPSRFVPSPFSPSSSTGDVTLGDILAQLQRMDAHLDTFSTKLYQVNVRVYRIAWQQVTMGGYALEASPPPPPLMAFDSQDEDDDDGDDDDASNDDDGDASFINEMST